MKRETLQSSLKEMGFEGRHLQEIEILVSTEKDLRELESFIIGNMNLNSVSEIIYKYREKLIEERTITEDEFVCSFETAVGLEGRHNALQDLLKCYIEMRWMVRFEENVAHKAFTLRNFYQTFIANPMLHIKRMMNDATMIQLVGVY